MVIGRTKVGVRLDAAGGIKTTLPLTRHVTEQRSSIKDIQINKSFKKKKKRQDRLRRHCILYKENPRADFVRITTDINQNAFLLQQHLMPTKQIYRQKSLGIPGKSRPAAPQTLAKLDARLAKEKKKKKKEASVNQAL